MTAMFLAFLTLLFAVDSVSPMMPLEDDQSFVRQGRKFTDLGPMRTIVGDWSIAIVLNLGDIYKTLEALEYQVTETFNSTAYLNFIRYEVLNVVPIDEETTTGKNGTGIHHTYQKYIKKFRSAFKANVESQRALFKKEIQQIREELQIFSYVQENVPTRVKRGFITSAIGSILKSVTGVATQGDITKLHKKLITMSKSVEDLDHITSLQTTLMNDIALKMEQKNQAALQTLKRVVESFQMSLKTVVLDADAELSTNLAIIMSVLDQHVTEIRSEVSLYNNFVQTLLHDLILLVNDKIPHSLVHPEKLLETLKEIKLHLTSYELGIPITNLFAYYENIYCTTHVAKNILLATCHLPLVERTKLQFNLYRTQKFPTYLANNLTRFVVTEVEHEFFGISGDHRTWMQFQRPDFQDKALILPNIILVPQNFLIYSDVTSCNAAIFLNDTGKIEKLCSQKLINLESFMFERLDELQIVVSTPVKETLVVACPDSNAAEARLRTTSHTFLVGTYQLSISPFCDVSSRNIYMKGKIHRESEITASIPDVQGQVKRIPEDLISYMDQNKDQLVFQEFSKILADIEKQQLDSASAINFQSILSRAREPEKQISLDKEFPLISLIFSSISLIGFCTVFYYVYFLYTKIRVFKRVIFGAQTNVEKKECEHELQTLAPQKSAPCLNVYGEAKGLLSEVK